MCIIVSSRMHSEHVVHYECAADKPKCALMQVQMCTHAEICNSRASSTEDCVPMTWSLHISTQEKVFSVECAQVQWGLYLESPLCIAQNQKRPWKGSNKGKDLPLAACYPISPVQKNVHRFWWGFHINRALEHSGEERGGEDEKEKVMPRKLASFKLSAQSTSLNGPSAVPNPLCPHDSTPGEVSLIPKSINDWTVNFWV